MSKWLAEFVSYLENNKLIEFRILEEGEIGFQNRFKIQKYTFLAQRFGLKFPYQHSIYLYGPYSTLLAREYYDLAKNPKYYNDLVPILPESFRSADFLNLVRGKDASWLEIATTLIARNKTFTEENALVENVEKTKHGFSTAFIKYVLKDLYNCSLVSIDRRF